jgi:hypothetical protein
MVKGIGNEREGEIILEYRISNGETTKHGSHGILANVGAELPFPEKL